MLHSYQKPLTTFSVLSSLWSIVSCANDLDVKRPGCPGVDIATYNITGSAGEPGFNWETGLFSDGPKGNATQVFWVNATSEDFDYIDAKREGCVAIFYDLPQDIWTKLDNIEACQQQVLGDQCASDLRDSFGDRPGPPTQKPSCRDMFYNLTKVPDSCTNLKGGSWEVVSMNDVNKRNTSQSCTTVDNNGQKSAYLSITKPGNGQAADFSAYDDMAKRGFVIVQGYYTFRQNNESISLGSTVETNCLYNRRVADGSRLPESMKKQPPPEPKPSDPAKGAASAMGVTGLIWGVILGAVMLLT